MEGDAADDPALPPPASRSTEKVFLVGRAAFAIHVSFIEFYYTFYFIIFKKVAAAFRTYNIQ